MEILILAVMTALGLLAGMFFIWQGYQSSQVSTPSPEAPANESPVREDNKESCL